MVWEPFAIAVVFGLVVSAGLYFIVMWPQVEPDDELAAASEASSAEPVTTADAPAAVDTAARTSDAPTTDAADVKATTSASLSSEHDDGGDPPAA